MKPLLAAFSAALLTYGSLDLLWVGVIAGPFYQRTLGHLMSGSVRWGAVALLYPLFASGVVLFAVRPALASGSFKHAALYGAALGLLVYGVYDLTNLALLKRWGVAASVVDIAWGVFVSAAVACAGFWAARAAG